MSKPSDIYRAFSRELLENFVWQLQNTRLSFDDAQIRGTEEGVDVSLLYSFECPSEEAATSLKAYLHEQADDEISIVPAGDTWTLKGQTDAFGFSLGTILDWVGYMCDAGQGSECRFDGWTVNSADSQESFASEALATELPADSADVDGGEEQTPAVDYPHMVIARILENIQPIDRGEKYEDPLTEVLAARGLGEVTGGGSQLNANFEIEYVELEIMLANLDDALQATRQELRRLGVPKGSELRFSREVAIPIVE